MAKTPNKAKAAMIAELLRRIDHGDDMRLLAKDASRIADQVGPADMAAAEHSLLGDGYTPAAINHLSTAFVLMLEYQRQVCSPKGLTQNGHILQKVVAEHGMFRCWEAELREAAADLCDMDCILNTTWEYRHLIHVVDHLGAMKEHFEREDDVILPYLRRSGWVNPCEAAEHDHAQLRADIDWLMAFATSGHGCSLEDFQAELAAGVGRFCSLLSQHLAYEDNLLWPLALVVIDDPAIWSSMKALCEEIGYCGIHTA